MPTICEKTKKLTPRQTQVVAFLKGRDWTSPTVIGRSVWGEGHHSASASPVCKKLVSMGFLHRNDDGHYRIADVIEPVPAE